MFWQLYVSAGFIFAANFVFASAAQLPTTKQHKLCEASHRLPSMGAFLEVQVVFDCAKPLLPQNILAIQSRLDDLEAQMSLYQPQSPINQLNKRGKLNPAPAGMLKVVRRALLFGEKTNGLFDITVNGKVGSWRDVVVVDQQIQFKKPGINITLDGIAKGYAVDEVAESLKTAGISSFLINFSGNMRWQGLRADAKPWVISLWNPVTRKATSLNPTQAAAGAGAIASSGGEHQGGHIIDPKSRQPVKPRWAQATVIAPSNGASAENCDTLSTVVFQMSLPEAQTLLHKHFPGYIAHFIETNGQVRHTTK